MSEEKADCAICNNTGWARYDGESGDSIEFDDKRPGSREWDEGQIRITLEPVAAEGGIQ